MHCFICKTQKLAKLVLKRQAAKRPNDKHYEVRFFNRNRQRLKYFFSFYLPKFLIDLFNISRPFPSRRDFSMDFWLITLAFICLPAVLMRFILWLFYIVSLGLVRKSVILQMVVVLQGRFVQTATHGSLFASVWFTKPNYLRPFR